MQGRSPLTTLAAPALVLGPAHAGKSELAMQLLAPDRGAIVIGTATLRNEAFQRRLDRLQGLRPAPWETFEAGADLPAALDEAARKAPQVLVDSVSQWLAGLVVQAAEDPDGGASEAAVQAQVEARVAELITIIDRHRAARIVLVSAEAGAGPTPPRPVERLYRKLAGEAHQRLAAACQSVVLVHAGLPQVLKP